MLPDVYHEREAVELEFVDGRIQFRCHGAFENILFVNNRLGLGFVVYKQLTCASVMSARRRGMLR